MAVHTLDLTTPDPIMANMGMSRSSALANHVDCHVQVTLVDGTKASGQLTAIAPPITGRPDDGYAIINRTHGGPAAVPLVDITTAIAVGRTPQVPHHIGLIARRALDEINARGGPDNLNQEARDRLRGMVEVYTLCRYALGLSTPADLAGVIEEMCADAADMDGRLPTDQQAKK